MITIENLLVRHGSFELALDLERASGCIGIYGPSGAGKTTLLETLAGLVRPHRGRIIVDGETVADMAKEIHVPPAKRGIGFVPQDDTLFPHLDVKQNIEYGLRISAAELADLTALLEINGIQERATFSLSGGERRRVAIARALAARPRLLLLDEPLSGLDSRRRDTALKLVRDLHTRTGTPLVLVSHHLNELGAVCDEIVELDEGRVLRRERASRFQV